MADCLAKCDKCKTLLEGQNWITWTACCDCCPAKICKECAKKITECPSCYISINIDAKETSATECVAPERFNRDYDRYQKTDLSTVFPNIPSAPTDLKHNVVDGKRLKRMILNNHVPLNCCGIIVLGLPYTGKTTILNTLFKSCIGKTDRLMERTKLQDEVLKIYDVCAYGAYPFEDFKWSHTTKRFMPVFFILSDLVRTCALRQLNYKELEWTDLQAHSIFENSSLDCHFNYLFEECKQMLTRKDIDKSAFQVGLSLVNCFDIGVSKAAYDFLPLFAFCFRKLIRFVFFSQNRDGANFDKIPDLSQDKYKGLPETFQIMQHFKRLNYLLQFSSGVFDTKILTDPFRTVMVATEDSYSSYRSALGSVQTSVIKKAQELNIEKTIDDKWVFVNKTEKSIKFLRKRVESKITKNNRLHITIPLKWIFLRSLIAHLNSKDVLFPFKEICNLAEKLEMNEDDVEKFLITFTDFASLLYCPVYESLSKYIITDIDKFMTLIHTLYHPESEQDENGFITKYGVIEQRTAKKIFGHISKEIMDILVSLGLAAKLSRGQLEIDDKPYMNEAHFMPNVRKGALDENKIPGSLRIRFSTSNKNENEATLSKSILSRHPPSKVKLIASEDVNCTKLKIMLESDTSFELHIIYHGGTFELRLVNIPPSPSIVSICTPIVEGFCYGMIHESNFKRGIDFSLGFKCLGPNSNYHVQDIMECKLCQDTLNDSQKNIVKLWTETLNMCKVPFSSESIREKVKESVDRKTIIDLANKLTNELLSDEQEKELKKKLDIDEKELTDYHGWELFTMMIIMWGKKNPDLVNPKKKLFEIINSLLDPA